MQDAPKFESKEDFLRQIGFIEPHDQRHFLLAHQLVVFLTEKEVAETKTVEALAVLVKMRLRQALFAHQKQYEEDCKKVDRGERLLPEPPSATEEGA